MNTILFKGLPKEVRVGRYHSLFANAAALPAVFKVTARTGDGVIMAVEHRELPIAGVQFHPESILSIGEGAGMAMIRNVVTHLYGRSVREE